MQEYMFHLITDTQYYGVITVLDCEIRLRTFLSKIIIPSCYSGGKVLVDLAMKSGTDEYRFIEFDVDSDGKIVFSSHKYVTVSSLIEQAANYYLQQKKSIVDNSFLTGKEKNKVLY